MKFKLGNEKLIVKKSRFGYTIQLNQKHFFYQTYGQPLKKKNSLYNQKLFQYVYNKMPAVRIFKL